MYPSPIIYLHIYLSTRPSLLLPPSPSFFLSLFLFLFSIPSLSLPEKREILGAQLFGAWTFFIYDSFTTPPRNRVIQNLDPIFIVFFKERSMFFKVIVFQKCISTGPSHRLLVHLLLFYGMDLFTPDAELELLRFHRPHLALWRTRPEASKLHLCTVRGSTAGCCFISLAVIFLWFTYNSEELMHLYPFWIRSYTNASFDLGADPFISSYMASPLIQA